MGFVWDKLFRARYNRRISAAQAYTDKECIKRMTPFVPVAYPSWRNAGKLRGSVRNPEPGKIAYVAPFAKSDYYAFKNHQRSGNPQGRRLWFEVMKKKDGAAIIKGAKAVMRRTK